MKFVRPLNREEKAQLSTLMRESSNYRVRKRAHVILLSHRKYKIDVLAEIFSVDRDTISDWIRRWEEGGIRALSDASRPGRPRKYPIVGKYSE